MLLNKLDSDFLKYLIARQVVPGERLPTPVGAVTLGVCPKAGYDRGCVEVSAK